MTKIAVLKRWYMYCRWCMVGLVVSALDCQPRGPGFKFWPGQKFGSRFLLYMRPMPTHLRRVGLHWQHAVSEKIRRRGRELATTLICRGQENEVANTSSPWQLRAILLLLLFIGTPIVAKRNAKISIFLNLLLCVHHLKTRSIRRKMQFKRKNLLFVVPSLN